MSRHTGAVVSFHCNRVWDDRSTDSKIKHASHTLTASAVRRAVEVRALQDRRVVEAFQACLEALVRRCEVVSRPFVQGAVAPADSLEPRPVQVPGTWSGLRCRQRRGL